MNSDKDVIYFGEMMFYVEGDFITFGRRNTDSNSSDYNNKTIESFYPMCLNGTSYIRINDELKVYYNAIINLSGSKINFEQIYNEFDLINFPFFNFESPIGTGSIPGIESIYDRTYLFLDLDSEESQTSLILSLFQYAKQFNQDVTLHIKYWAKKEKIKFSDEKNVIKNPKFINYTSKRLDTVLYVTEYYFGTQKCS